VAGFFSDSPGHRVDNNKSTRVKQFFEADQAPWEDLYHRNRVEANMYWDRRRTGLRLATRYFPDRGRVLEIGSGPGYLSQDLLRCRFDVVSCDLSLRMACQTRQRTGRDTVFVADIRSLPFQPASFDAIALIGVMSYVSDPVVVLGNLRLLLKPDGTLLVSSANQNLLFSALDRRLKNALTRIGLRRLGPAAKDKSFFANECTYYKAREFNQLVCGAGYSYLKSENIGFGRAKLLGTHVFPESLDVVNAKLLSRLSRIPGFRWLSSYAFANVACFRSKAVT